MLGHRYSFCYITFSFNDNYYLETEDINCCSFAHSYWMQDFSFSSVFVVAIVWFPLCGIVCLSWLYWQIALNHW